MRTLLVLCLLSSPAWAVGCRLYLAEQDNWSANRGFVFDLEADSNGAPQCRLNQYALVAGAADGTRWQWIVARPGWELGRTYTAVMVIGPDYQELWLDGQQIGRNSIVVAANNSPLVIRDRPAGFTGASEQKPVQDSFVATAGDSSIQPDLGATSIAPEVALFEAPPPIALDWPLPQGQVVTYTATFHFETPPDLHASAPFIDRYGQSRHADWPGKIRSDDDLVAAGTDEQDRLAAMGLPDGFDRWGGATNLGWQEEATGFFRVVQRNGFYWLVDPDGYPTFYTGVCTAPSYSWDKTPVTGREYLFEQLPSKDLDSSSWGWDVWGQDPGIEYFAVHTPLLIQRYGPEWRSISDDLFQRRLKTWGFSGLGKWSQQTGDLPISPVLHYSAPSIAGHPDVFDGTVQDQIRESLRPQIEPNKEDPRILGWSIQNEIEGIIHPWEIVSILSRGSNIPAKRALVEEALYNIYRGNVSDMAAAWSVPATTIEDFYADVPVAPAQDVEALRQFYEGRYHKFLYETVKGLDPNHLYFGFWIVPVWWENETDWVVTAPYSDVIGYDRYAPELTNELLDRLLSQTGKPAILGEFSFPPYYGFARGFGVYAAANAIDDAAAGDAYARTLASASAHPLVLGTMWFQYRDQPLTGRGPGSGEGLVYGEHYAFGIIDIADRPKWDMVERMRAANIAAAQSRWNATNPPAPEAVPEALKP